MRRIALFAVVGALAACRSPDPTITAEPDEATHARQGDAEIQIPRTPTGVLPPGAADKILPVGSPPLVRVLDPGTEPRADLSYAIVKGSSQRMVMGMDMGVQVKVKGQASPPMPMPHMAVSLDTKAVEKNAAGEVRVEARVTSIAVEPSGAQQEQMARALQPQLDGMKGLGIGYWVTAKGLVHDVKLDVPVGAPPAARQLMGGMGESFESMVLALPQSPVGPGARWQVVTRVGRGGTDIVQSAIYTLKSRSGARVGLESTLTQAAGNDVIHTAQMPAGMNAKLKSFTSSGSGTTSLDLASVVPESGATRLRTGMTLAVDAPGADPEESAVDTTVNVQIARP